jgi:hypothetical protein
MIQTDLFPYLIDHDLIEFYLANKKEIEKINRKIAKIEHTRIKSKITTTYLRLPQQDGTFALQNYSLCKLHEALGETQQELLVHYESRKVYLLRLVKSFQFIMNHLSLNHYARASSRVY